MKHTCKNGMIFINGVKRRNIEFAVINNDIELTFRKGNLKGQVFEIIEKVGDRITLNIEGRTVDFYGNEVTVIPSEKEIYPTIVKIQYENYSDNVSVTKKNVRDYYKMIRNARRKADIKWKEVIEQGDVKIYELKEGEKYVYNVLMVNNKSMDDPFLMDMWVRKKDNKVKLDFDTMGDWKRSWQQPRWTEKGQYVKLYGHRVYFYNDLPTYKYPENYFNLEFYTKHMEKKWDRLR